MHRIINKLKAIDRQTIYFILMTLIYMIALAWTTLQSYVRLEYSRSDKAENFEIQQQIETK